MHALESGILARLDMSMPFSRRSVSYSLWCGAEMHGDGNRLGGEGAPWPLEFGTGALPPLLPYPEMGLGGVFSPTGTLQNSR